MYSGSKTEILQVYLVSHGPWYSGSKIEILQVHIEFPLILRLKDRDTLGKYIVFHATLSKIEIFTN